MSPTHWHRAARHHAVPKKTAPHTAEEHNRSQHNTAQHTQHSEGKHSTAPNSATKETPQHSTSAQQVANPFPFSNGAAWPSTVVCSGVEKTVVLRRAGAEGQVQNISVDLVGNFENLGKRHDRHWEELVYLSVSTGHRGKKIPVLLCNMFSAFGSGHFDPAKVGTRIRKRWKIAKTHIVQNI